VSEDPQQLEAEIERTRERLGETAEALAAKADVKARAQQKATELTGRLQSKANQAKRQITQRPVTLAVAAGAVGALVLTLVIISRRRRT
jgi:vacuolar-type H+-ATPase subunit E/Vma4